MKIKLSNWRINLIKLYIFSNIIDVGGGLGLKYLSSGMLMLLLFGKRKMKLNYIELVLFMVLPVSLFAYSYLFCSVSLSAALSSVTFCLAVIFSIVIANERVVIDDILKYFLRVMYAIAAATIIVFFMAYVLKVTGNSGIYIDLGSYLQHSLRMGFFGYNYISGILMPIVYCRCSMFLIFALSVACYYKDKRAITVIFSANMLVTSTANILFSVVIMMFYILGGLVSKKCKILTGTVGGLGVVSIILIKYQDIYMKFYEYFDDLTMGSYSSKIKLGHISSILENMFSSVRIFLFGMGGGSSFYSKGLERVVTNTEVSQFECWRRFGTIYTLLFFLYILYVICKTYRLGKQYRMISIGLLMLFLATASNPQLLSPLFLTILFLVNCWSNETQKRIC